MAMTVYTNIYSTIAQNNLTTANNSLGKSIERLSSGLRINQASDDASGLAISEKLRGQIRGMAKASMNAQDAISFLQTAEGGMEVIGDMLQRMRELAVQAGNGTYTTNDRAELQKEVDQLKDEINRIASSTEYNTKKLLTGQASALWSTSNPNELEAIVRGAASSGNYNIDIEAVAGTNYVYKTDIMSMGAVDKTIQTYDYSFSYKGNASGASFSNVYGEVKNQFDVAVNTGTIPTFSAPTTTGSNTMTAVLTEHNVDTIGKYTGKLDNGKDSTFDVTLTVSTATTSNAMYVVIEAVQDGDLSGATSQNAFKITTYDAITGERTEIRLTAADIVSGQITVNDFTFDFNNVTDFAAGDKMVFAFTPEVTTHIDVTLSSGGSIIIDQLSGMGTYKAGDGPTLGINENAGNNLGYAILEMDDSGNISIGHGIFTVSTDEADYGTHYVTVKPTLTTKSLFEIADKDSIGTTVDKSKTQLVGGIYPAGVEVTVKKGALAIATAVTTTGKYLSDLNLRVAAVITAAVTSTGSYIIEYVGSTKDITDTAAATMINVSDFKVTFVDAATGVERNVTLLSANLTISSSGTSVGLGGGVTVNFGGNNANLTAGDKVVVQTQTGAALNTANTTHATVSMGNFSRQIAADNLDNIKFHNVQMDSAGNIMRSTLTMALEDNTAGVLKFSTPDNKVATLDTKLKDISLFTNKDGRMVLDNTQELQIVGNDKSVKIYIEGNDTVEELRKKLNDALLSLGMGTGDTTVDNNLVRYVTEEEAQASGNLAVAGTFVFQGAIAGDNSKIDFIGDQGVLDALSIANIQKGENSDMKVTVTDAHTGKLIGSDTVSDGILRGVINNIDVKINNPQLITSYNSTTGKMTFLSPAEAVRMQLHIADNRTEIQIGANEGQKFDTSIAQMDTTALEINDALVNTMDNSQKAITKFDQALAKVNGARATIGAQINRLEYTMRNLSVSRQNLVSAESRIRDLDVAEESANFASKQVLVNSAIAMLAQANQLPQTALQLIRG